MVLKVEIAATPTARRHGLMFRRELAPDSGLLLAFDHLAQHAITMQNVRFPLDLVFLDERLVVIDVIPGAPAGATGPFAIPQPSQYVLELNAGVASQLGYAPGVALRWA